MKYDQDLIMVRLCSGENNESIVPHDTEIGRGISHVH